MQAQTSTEALSLIPAPSRAPLLPGVGLCVLVTAIAYRCEAVEVRLMGRPWLEALVFAILFGVAP